METLALKLKLIREMRGLSQFQVAARSGIGVKSISSFEGARVASIKVVQLVALLTVYGMTLVQFLQWAPEAAEPEVALEQPAPCERRREPIDPLRNFRRGDDDDRTRWQSPLAYAV